jgi:hypothetical protein
MVWADHNSDAGAKEGFCGALWLAFEPLSVEEFARTVLNSREVLVADQSISFNREPL